MKAPLAFLLIPIAVGTTHAVDSYSIDVMFIAPSYSGCNDSVVADGNLACDRIDAEILDLGELTPNFAELVVGGVPVGAGPGVSGGIGGIQFGIEYVPSLDLYGWTLCTGGSEIPQVEPVAWPASGSGNAVTWSDGCYLVTDNDDGVTKIGFFSVRSGGPGFLRAAGDPRIGGIALVADCLPTTFEICRAHLGWGDVEVDGPGGHVACGTSCADPLVEVSTWSRVKALYRGSASD